MKKDGSRMEYKKMVWKTIVTFNITVICNTKLTLHFNWKGWTLRSFQQNYEICSCLDKSYKIGLITNIHNFKRLNSFASFSLFSCSTWFIYWNPQHISSSFIPYLKFHDIPEKECFVCEKQLNYFSKKSQTFLLYSTEFY